MAEFVFKLPDVGEGTAEAEIVAWHVKPGDAIEEDAPLVDVMTDKATVEMTTPVTGRVLAIHGEPGEMAAVGSTLAVIALEGEASSEAPRAAPPPPALRATSPTRGEEDSNAKPLLPLHGGGGPPKVVEGARAAPPIPRAPGTKPLASPAVRRRAHELGVALQFVPGSGPGGRIQHEDLDSFLERRLPAGIAQAPTERRRSGETEIKVIGLRRRIAEKMQEAKRRIPHFAYVEEVDVTELEALRVHLNATKRADQPRLTVLPFLIVGLSRLLPRYPQINATFDDDAGIVHRHAPLHLGMATQTPNGLVVPVIRHAEAMDLWELAAEILRLSAAARDGKAKADELRGSTLTLTSLGPLGGVVTTPVINHPEVAIIGPNKIIERPVVREGAVTIRKMMNVSSSFDHRVVDGYDAAAFIQELRGLLEHPATLFMDRS